MFNFFKKNPIKSLKTRHEKLLEEAMHIQRSGDLKLYAIKMEEAARIEKEIESLRQAK